MSESGLPNSGVAVMAPVPADAGASTGNQEIVEQIVEQGDQGAGDQGESNQQVDGETPGDAQGAEGAEQDASGEQKAGEQGAKPLGQADSTKRSTR